MSTLGRSSRCDARGVLLASLLVAASCRRDGGPPATAIRLTDRFRPTALEGARAPGDVPPRAQWRFAAPSPGPPGSSPWSAEHGVEGFGVREGLLAGRATDERPLLHVDRGTDGDPDLLQAIEVRMRASAGTTLAVYFSQDEKADVDSVLTNMRADPQEGTTPLVAGEEMRTYQFRRAETFSSREIRHVYLRPTNERGARFEIESVRLVFRREHLASIPSGPSWQGLSGVFREALVARSPESIRLEATLPPEAWLDLSIGTIEDGPVTFRVGLEGARAGPAEVLLERTVTTPHRWEAVPLDLSAFGGRSVRLSLSLSAQEQGRLGFWGEAVVRRRRPPPAGPRGVIVVWADTLRSDHLDAYGYDRPTAPVVRRMASEGTLFRNCVAQATWTKVSTPSLLTSLYPTSHGVRAWDDRLASSATTLAEVYRDAGYATFSFASNNFVGQMTNLHQGFDEVHEDGSLPDRQSSKTATVGMDRFLPWLEKHRDAPFFALLNFLDPHDPFKPRAPYDSLFADPAGEREHERQTDALRKVIKVPFLKRFAMPSREEFVQARVDPEPFLRRNRDWYDGSIRGMDVEIGRLFERLRALGLDERTLVVFASDHGEEFLEHGRTFHGFSTYGEVSRVPLIVRGPSVSAGRVVDETVQIIDVMPTLLEMTGLRAPAQIQGQSLVPLLRTASGSGPTVAAADRSNATGGWKRRPAIIEKVDSRDPPPLDIEATAIVAEGFKLVHHTRRHPPTPEYELFDFTHDPLDHTDLAPQRPELVARLGQELKAWRRSAEAARLKPDAETAKSVSGEELERLRALGYIQ